MRIIPFAKINDINFGISQEQLISVLGEPNQKRINSLGLIELCYPSATYRFGDVGLEEATLDAAEIELETIKISFDSLGSYLREHDPNCFERFGFFVSPAYGIAYDSEFPCWVTAFPQPAITLWQSIGKKNT